jgi:hypothetical protein
MKAVKAVSVIVIICLLIDIFGGIENGTISNGEIVLNAVFIFANVMILLDDD